MVINSNGHIFVGGNTRGGWIKRSNDNGDSWIGYGIAQNPNYYLRVFSLAINSNGYVFAGTSVGVFRNINTTVSVKEENSLPSSFQLSQNYPNPFNPSTTIKYSIPSVETHGHAYVQLKVYDILGREVATLVNMEQKAGFYEVQFTSNNGQLTSGIYFYQLRAGDFVETKKMLLLR